jgi:hypothetical protein
VARASRHHHLAFWEWEISFLLRYVSNVMRYVEGEGPARSVYSSFDLEEAKQEQRKRQAQEPTVRFYLSRH